jgi:hypothetical protein
VRLIAQANRFGHGADRTIARSLTWHSRTLLAIGRIWPTGGRHVSDGEVWLASALAIADGRDSRLKFLLDNSGIIHRKRVLD